MSLQWFNMMFVEDNLQTQPKGMYVDSVNDARAACLCASLCKALHLLSLCSSEDIIASCFHISIAHYAVPYHFILKIKQNRIFKINDVRHISLSLYL